MSLLTRLKASVGVGGAALELSAPRVAVGGSSVPIRIHVRGGRVEQRLRGVELNLEVWPDRARAKSGVPQIRALGRALGSEGRRVAAGARLSFEQLITLPSCEALYFAAPDRYAELTAPASWAREGPLELRDDWESARLVLDIGAELPGALDPRSRQQLHVIPEAAGKLSRVPAISEAELERRLAALGVAGTFVSGAGEHWFSWFARADGKVVGYSPILVVNSLRREGIVRAFRNPNVPEASALGQMPNEDGEPVAGDLDRARELARRAVANARAGVLLPRPVGKAWVTLSALRLL